LGTARLVYDPSQSEYSLCLETTADPSAPGRNMEVAFAVHTSGDGRGGLEGDGFNDTSMSKRPATSGVADAEDDREREDQREWSAREYLEQHGLTTFMQFLMQSLMKDKPADPYAFLQKQVTKRMVSELSKGMGGSEEEGVDAFLAHINTEAPQISTGQLEELEREAAATSEQLRLDNKRLRETAAQLKSRYWQLLEDNQLAAPALADAPVGDAAHGDYQVSVTGLGFPPLGPHETPQLAAYREIANLQTEVSSLAKENGSLVEELAQMRSRVDAVRSDIAMMSKQRE